MKELQTALKGFVKKNETLKIETKVSKPQLYVFSSDLLGLSLRLCLFMEVHA